MWDEPTWKQIYGFPNYYISNGGRVINLKLRKIMATVASGKHEYVWLSAGGKRYFRNVAVMRDEHHGR